MRSKLRCAGESRNELIIGFSTPLAGAIETSDASGTENGDGGAAKVQDSADAVAGSGDGHRGGTDNPAGLGPNGIPCCNPKGSAKVGKATKFYWKKVINPGIGATKYIDCLREAIQEEGLDFYELMSRFRELIREAGGDCIHVKVPLLDEVAKLADAPKPNGSGGGGGFKRAREQQVESPGQPSSVHPVLKRRPAEQPPCDAASDTRFTFRGGGGRASKWGGAPGGGVTGLQDAGLKPRLDERMYTQAGLETAAARIALIDPVVRRREAERLIGVEEATEALEQAVRARHEKQAVADKARSDAAVACSALDEALEQRKADLSDGKAGVLAAARAAPPRAEMQETFEASILVLDNATAAVQECREQLASGAVTFTLKDMQEIHPTLGEPAKAFLDRRAAALKAEAEALDAAASVEALQADAEARRVRLSRIVRAGEAQVAALCAKGMDDPLQQLRTLLAWSRSYLRRLPEEQQLAAVEEAAAAVESHLMDDMGRMRGHFWSVYGGQQLGEDAAAFLNELAGYMVRFP